MVLAQALSWDAADDTSILDDDRKFQISIFGMTSDRQSICITTTFKPYFFIKIPIDNPTPADEQQLFKSLGGSRIPGLKLSWQKRQDLSGFQDGKRETFLRVECDSLINMRKLAKKPIQFKTFNLHRRYESNVDPVLRFMHLTNVQSTGWFEYPDELTVSVKNARTQIDLFATDWKQFKPVDKDDISPFVVASVDIEAYSASGMFPDPHEPHDCVFQIAITLCRLGSTDIYDKTCLCFPKTDNVIDGNIISFDTERELLLGFRDYVVNHDIDIITGWNVFGFDFEYLVLRATHCGLVNDEGHSEFYDIGKSTKPGSYVKKKLSSSALGDNMLKMINMPGRFVFDLFQEVKREYKLDSYSLNHVSKTYLNDSKIDMPVKEMFRIFEGGNPSELALVADYCIKDTILPHRILDKLCLLLNLLEMAKATWVPINYLCERGQQIKVFSQITRKALEMGWMVPTVGWAASKQETYQGATVLEAQTGAYYTPITALDFEGLYPSIMIAHNLCYSTLVTDPRYENLPHVEYKEFNIGDKIHKFAQTSRGVQVASLLPSILIELKQFRKSAKRDMANAQTPQMYQVYNGKQLAYKISMNSVYGFTGASPGMLPEAVIAAAVTAEGRAMIEKTKEVVETTFAGSKVRYGDTDSVMVEFDVGDRTGEEAVRYSWELGEQAAILCNKEFKKPNNLELEKVYFPYILYSKKRYAASMWTMSKDGDMIKKSKPDVKGLQLVRRDNVPFVREVSQEILDIILESNNPEPAKELAKLRGDELKNGRVPMDKLILSQKLAATYKNENLAHVRVRDKIRERDPGSEPRSGDRVQYVLVKTDKKGATQGDRAEDPEWARRHSQPLDYDYYFTNKFRNPVCDLLEPLVKDPHVNIFGMKPKKEKTIDELFSNYDLNKCNQ